MRLDAVPWFPFSTAMTYLRIRSWPMAEAVTEKQANPIVVQA